MDPDTEMVKYASETGCKRIELYTEPYAMNFSNGNKSIEQYVKCSNLANKLEMGINAGHDLNLNNIEFKPFSNSLFIPGNDDKARSSRLIKSFKKAILGESLYHIAGN